MIYWTITSTGKVRRFLWSNPKLLTPETAKRMKRQKRRLEKAGLLFTTKEEAVRRLAHD